MVHQFFRLPIVAAFLGPTSPVRAPGPTTAPAIAPASEPTAPAEETTPAVIASTDFHRDGAQQTALHQIQSWDMRIQDVGANIDCILHRLQQHPGLTMSDTRLDKHDC